MQALEWSRLSADEIQAKADALANEAVSLLQKQHGRYPGNGYSASWSGSGLLGHPSNGPVTTAYITAPASSAPDINSSDVPAGLTEDTQPAVQLNVKVQNPAA